MNLAECTDSRSNLLAPAEFDLSELSELITWSKEREKRSCSRNEDRKGWSLNCFHDSASRMINRDRRSSSIIVPLDSSDRKKNDEKNYQDHKKMTWYNGRCIRTWESFSESLMWRVTLFSDGSWWALPDITDIVQVICNLPGTSALHRFPVHGITTDEQNQSHLPSLGSIHKLWMPWTSWARRCEALCQASLIRDQLNRNLTHYFNMLYVPVNPFMIRD